MSESDFSCDNMLEKFKSLNSSWKKKKNKTSLKSREIIDYDTINRDCTFKSWIMFVLLVCFRNKMLTDIIQWRPIVPEHWASENTVPVRNVLNSCYCIVKLLKYRIAEIHSPQTQYCSVYNRHFKRIDSFIHSFQIKWREIIWNNTE